MHDYDEDNDGRFLMRARPMSATPGASRKSRVTASSGRGCLERGQQLPYWLGDSREQSLHM
jgi:hypothetical protein